MLKLATVTVAEGMRGSILFPELFHSQLINPIWSDAQPYDTVFFSADQCCLVESSDYAQHGQGVTEVNPLPIWRAVL